MSRFVLNERFKAVHFASAPADLEAPTAAEIAAATDLIGSTSAEELEDIQGFEVEPSDLPMSGFASIKVGTLPGEQTYPASRLSFYVDDTVRTIYSLFGALTNGHVGFFPDGISTGEESYIFPYQVASRVRRVAKNAPAIVDVNMSIQVEYEGTQAA